MSHVGVICLRKIVKALIIVYSVTMKFAITVLYTIVLRNVMRYLQLDMSTLDEFR